MMSDTVLSSIPGISHNWQSALKKSGFLTVSDVLLSSISDISRRCRLAPQVVQEIVDSIARALDRPPSLLRDVIRDGSEVVTTGDTLLDQMLGGGIRVGMIWELAGEGRVFPHVLLLGYINNASVCSASGKTQLALQLSLLVQLPVTQGGLNGSACYLTTSTSLPTPRLIELLHENPLLLGSHCNLDNVQTSVIKSVNSLLYVLSQVLPATIDAAKARFMPLKLLIIDSLADLLLEDKISTTTTLADRSRNLSAIAAQLHALAATHQLAVVAINRVTDVWERPNADPGLSGELIYADHARIFGCAEGGSKSAALGLVWANQVNARIMLTRTDRRHAISARNHDRKRQRAEGGVVRMDDSTVRRLTVIFSSVCTPASIEFIITSQGVETCLDDLNETLMPPAPIPATGVSAAVVVPPPLAEVSPLDVGSVVSDLRIQQYGDAPIGELEDEEEEAYWRGMDDFSVAGDLIDLINGMNPSEPRAHQ